MNTFTFAKMSGAGNDFIVIDNRRGQFDGQDTSLIRQLCTRRLSVGADGLMLLSGTDEADFAMAYFNADGSRAAMCGNGGRCIARFAVLLGLVPDGQSMEFVAPSGRYQAVASGSQVDLKLIPPRTAPVPVTLSIEGQTVSLDMTDTGVPHAVQVVPAVEAIDVERLGRLIRTHARFCPHGTNANFIEIVDDHTFKIRTYERGVEGETLACGTGAAAAALVAIRKGLVQSPVKAITRSGSVLEMTVAGDKGQTTLLRQKGEARLIYWGEGSPEARASSPPAPGV